MMNMLVAAIRTKNKSSNRDTGLVLRPQYPHYVLYDSDGDEVECNLSTMKMSYGSNSKTALTDVIISPRKGFWSNRTKMERHLIMLIGALFLVTIGLMVAAAVMSYNKQITLVFLSGEDKTTVNPTVAGIALNSTKNSTFDANSESMVTTMKEVSNHTSSPNDQESTETITVLKDNINSSNSLYSAYFKSIANNNGLVDDNYDILLSDPNICNTSACQTAGKLILGAMNLSVDPCDDFYEFSCGGWVASHTIPKDKSRLATFDELDEKLKQSIKEELSHSPRRTDSESVTYASNFYKACIDEATIESLGVSPLRTALNSIGGWPLSGDKHMERDWRDSLAQQIADFAFASIFSISIQPDANDTLVNRVYYDSAGFGLGRNQLVDQKSYPDIVNAYKNYILESALLLGAQNDSQTHKDIEDLLDFESKLANLSLPQEDKRNSSVWYNRMTFAKFNELTAKRVDWLNLTNSIYSKLNSTIRVKSEELVIVQDIGYFKGVTELLEKTPKRVIANYLGWVTVMSLGSYTTKKFREVVFEFNHVVTGVEQEAELWRVCVSRLSISLDYAVSRIYVDKHFTEKDKKEASLMINDIQESYNQLIRESDWLDDITKNKSLIKLNAIRHNVAFPDWMLINKELDKHYDLKQKVDSKKSFENLLYLQYNSVLREFKSLREKVNLTLSWPMPPAMVNAAYEPTQNSITIPAAILKTPFFDSQRPAYLNYGSIGVVVGHEMTHGFDDQGSEFDPKGDLINWWTEKIHKRFEEKAQCFINEYHSIYDPVAKMNLNGINTVGENIADNGGLRESYNAYQSYVKRHGEQQRLPHVSQYTPEQLFFVSYANTWCNLMRPEALKTQIQYNPHSPGKYRANVPVSNFKSFSDVFKCKPNSRMNRKDKCVLW